jgi:hypothetical protein
MTLPEMQQFFTDRGRGCHQPRRRRFNDDVGEDRGVIQLSAVKPNDRFSNALLILKKENSGSGTLPTQTTSRPRGITFF